MSSSFNNPGYEPHPRDYNGDDSDASPFTIPEYEEISTVLFQRQGKPSGRQERDPLYAEIGPSLAAKGRKTRDHQRDGEIQSPQVNGHAFEKMNRTTGRLPTQIHNDIAKHQGRKRQNPIAASNPTYESFPREFKSNSSSQKNDSLDRDTIKTSPTGDQRETSSMNTSREQSPDSGYSNLAKREFHKDALKREEPHYSKPSSKMFCPTSTLESSVGAAARNNNFYAPLGMGLVLPSNGNKFVVDGYSQLDPSTLMPAVKRKDPQKSRTSQDQLHHGNSVHPDLDRLRPKRRPAFDTAEDNENQSRKENKTMKKSRSRSSKTKASGQLGPAEERIEYENYTYGHPRNNQEGWDGNPRVDNPRKDGTAVRSSLPRPSKTRASGQLDFPEEHGTDENFSYFPQHRYNQEGSRDQEAPILYLESELGPDETII